MNIKSISFFFLVFLFSCENLFSSHIIVSGNVSGIWDTDTVLVMDNLLVPNGGTLQINPNVLILFQGHYVFRISGQVQAWGEENQAIIFSVNDTSGFLNYQTNEGAWNGLLIDHISPQNDSSIFNYCHFEFGKAVAVDSDTSYWYGGAACIHDCDKIRFSNCTFKNNRAFKNGGALYAKKSNFLIKNCTFEYNSCGQDSLYGYGGGICLEYSNCVIYHNNFANNSSTGVGGGLSFEFSDPKIESNYFNNNYSAIGGGIVCLRSNGTNPIVNNLVIGNSSLFFGGGIAIIEAAVPFTNNTIVGNYSGAGGGLYLNFSSFPVFKNCIFWNNYDFGGVGPQVYIWDTYSAPEFYFCDMEGGVEQFGGSGGVGIGFIGIYSDCIEDDPIFSGIGQHPYSLTENSPCINSGTPDTTGLNLPENDFAMNSRIRNERVDIGAYEAQQPSWNQEIIKENYSFSICPNPASKDLCIKAQLKNSGNLSIYLLDSFGKKTTLKENMSYQKGSLDITFDLSQFKLSPGIYFIRINSSNIQFTRKLVIVQ